MNNFALKKSPIYSILFNPTSTFREILTKKNRGLQLLFIIGCVWQATNATWNYSSGTFISSNLVIGILFFLCVNWPALYIISAIVTWVAKYFGGNGTTKDTMAVTIWSFAPGIIAVALYVLAILIFGEEIIRRSTALGSLFTVRTILIYIKIAISIWAFFIFIKGLSFVHNISWINAIIVAIIPLAFFYALIFSLTLI